jgi:hypothetical protein
MSELFTNPKMDFGNNLFLGSAMFRIAENRASERIPTLTRRPA